MEDYRTLRCKEKLGSFDGDLLPVRELHAIFFKWDSAPRLTSLSHSFATDSDSFWPFKCHIFLRKLTNFTSICP